MNTNTSACFSKLVLELPQWIEALDSLIHNVEVWRIKHSEDQNATQPRREKRSSSTDSMRPVEIATEGRQRTLARKSVTNLSQNGGRRPSRKISVVHYDACIQKQVEKLVGMISAGRGHLRKGRMAARFSSMSAFRPRVDSVGETSGLEGLRGTAFPSTIRKRTNSDRCETEPGTPTGDSTKALSDVELALSDSQMLCEQVAYQLLRDGDCDENLDLLKSSFELILSIATEQVKGSPELGCEDDEEQSNAKKLKSEEDFTSRASHSEYAEEFGLTSFPISRRFPNLPQLTAC